MMAMCWKYLWWCGGGGVLETVLTGDDVALTVVVTVVVLWCCTRDDNDVVILPTSLWWYWWCSGDGTIAYGDKITSWCAYSERLLMEETCACVQVVRCEQVIRSDGVSNEWLSESPDRWKVRVVQRVAKQARELSEYYSPRLLHHHATTSFSSSIILFFLLLLFESPSIFHHHQQPLPHPLLLLFQYCSNPKNGWIITVSEGVSGWLED